MVCGEENLDEKIDSDEKGFFCMSCAVDDRPSCSAIGSGTTLVTLDSASDAHCAPPWFGAGCVHYPDSGPVLRDAQKRPIPFESIAEVPMMTTAGGSSELLKVKMRLGPTISKPLFSLCRMMDAGAKCWLSSEGSYMEHGTSRVPVGRQNDSLAIEVRAFASENEARVEKRSLTVVPV